MKIFFIYTNINGFHSDTYSFGLSTIISVAKEAGHEIKVFLVKTKEDYKELLKEVKEFSPKVVGFSSVSSQFHFIKELAQLIKESLPNSIIVCGGVHPTINPQCINESDHLDAVFVGEGEEAFIEFLKKIDEGAFYRDTKNLAYVENSQLVVNELRPRNCNLDSVPFPDRDSVLFEETLRTVGYAPFFFSKGCPYLCTYCSNHAIAKRYGSSRNTPRFRSPENCIREIEDVISRFKITTIGIFDDILGIDRKWRDEFLKKYKEKIRIRFFCLLRANLVDEKFVRLLKNAGCYRISMGVESGNDYIRNTVMNRGLSEKQIIKAFDLCRQYRIQTNSLNIIGTPGETEEMIWDTIHLNRRLRATSSGVNIFYPYKGTQLGDHCFSEGLVNEDLYYSFSSERRSSVLNYPDDFKEKLVYYSRNWEDLINKGNISYWLKKFVKGLLVKVQIWDFLIKFKKSIRRFFKK